MATQDGEPAFSETVRLYNTCKVVHDISTNCTFLKHKVFHRTIIFKVRHTFECSLESRTVHGGFLPWLTVRISQCNFRPRPPPLTTRLHPLLHLNLPFAPPFRSPPRLLRLQLHPRHPSSTSTTHPLQPSYLLLLPPLSNSRELSMLTW